MTFPSGTIGHPTCEEMENSVHLKNLSIRVPFFSTIEFYWRGVV